MRREEITVTERERGTAPPQLGVSYVLLRHALADTPSYDGADIIGRVECDSERGSRGTQIAPQ